MLTYPQLATGALSQFPVQKRHSYRTLVNTAADGTVVKLADSGAETVEWQLKYMALSDAELSALIQFFTAAEGSLNGFTFLDPIGNLLAWSNDLSDAVWDAAPLLTLSGAITDPSGGNQAWQISNTGGGAQDLSQTVMAPGGYVYSFSVYVKAAEPATVTILLGSNRYERTVGTTWQRITCSGTGDAAATSMMFGIELGAGTIIDAYGIQAEPQATTSLYKASTTGGCYENARLKDDTLSFSTLGLDCHAATVNILYASHL
jgi:hypothetical protein